MNIEEYLVAGKENLSQWFHLLKRLQTYLVTKSDFVST